MKNENENEDENENEYEYEKEEMEELNEKETIDVEEPKKIYLELEENPISTSLAPDQMDEIEVTSIEEILSNPEILPLFGLYLSSIGVEESLFFWFDCVDFVLNSSDQERKNKAKKIWDEYLEV